MLLLYAKNYYSQNGEDGVIEEIFKRLEITSGWLCEFGAGDGKTISNSYYWVKEHGFKVVYIENGDEDYQRILKVVDEHPVGQIIAIKETVTPDNINSILEGTPIPSDFEMLSIDIDSYDYDVWEGITKYNPKVVIIEVNSSLLPGVLHTYKGGPIDGNSFTSTIELGKRKGYTPVCHTGNLIFVRDDLVHKVLIPDDMFVWNWVPVEKRFGTKKMIMLNPIHLTSG